MIYQTEIYNGYVWEVAREKVLFHLLMKLFLVEGNNNPGLFKPQTFQL